MTCFRSDQSLIQFNQYEIIILKYWPLKSKHLLQSYYHIVFYPGATGQMWFYVIGRVSQSTLFTFDWMLSCNRPLAQNYVNILQIEGERGRHQLTARRGT